MGCDIHMHVERREGDRWVWIRPPTVIVDVPTIGRDECGTWGYGDWRSYRAFARLADVRSISGEAIAPPRGFPKDATNGVRADYEDCAGDAHTPSWLMLSEILNAQPPEGGWGPYGKFFAFIQGFGAPDELRLVFWFDN